MKNSTLVHIERGDEWLMMHRVKKENDLNKDKWIGLGGKFEDGESPEECALRECREEAGIIMLGYRYRGIVTFVSDIYETEYMHLFTCDKFIFENENCEDLDNQEEKEKMEDCEGLDSQDEKEKMENCEDLDSQEEKLEDCNLQLHDCYMPQDGSAISNRNVGPNNSDALPDCDEGELAWIKKSEFNKFQQWEGDRLFLDLLEKDVPFFSMKLKYEGDTLVYAALNGKQIR